MKVRIFFCTRICKNLFMTLAHQLNVGRHLDVSVGGDGDGGVDRAGHQGVGGREQVGRDEREVRIEVATAETGQTSVTVSVANRYVVQVKTANLGICFKNACSLFYTILKFPCSKLNGPIFSRDLAYSIHSSSKVDNSGKSLYCNIRCIRTVT